MSKKDFELIARVLREHNHDHREGEYTSPTILAEYFADALAATNPRFDRARFVAACMGER